MSTDFGPDFAWGVATSAYQIEGGRFEGGKGESIWDRFSDLGRMPESGDVACDHYHRWREDVALMADLGVSAYRFSIAWSRVLPAGAGSVNHEGIRFYRRLIEALMDAGIRPWPTLYHWDLPQALQEDGGWANRATVDAFSRYAAVVAEAFGDVVTSWITHNEPWVAAFIGHLEGVFAPGLRDWPTALSAAHHILLSHGRAVAVIKDRVPNANVGIALDCRPASPARDRPEDHAATRHFDGFRNRWFFDPVFGKGYPSDMIDAYRAAGRAPHWDKLVHPGDLADIAAPIEFLGVNYYTSLEIAPGQEETEDTGVAAGASPPDGYTEMGWPITPAALPEYLEHLHRTYAPASIVITENGASFSDSPGPDGRVRDARRIAYLDVHTSAVARARASGVPVDGYFLWSLLDNLEWVHGYAQRFGIVHVDHTTGVRTPKDSYDWYRRFIRAIAG